MKRILILLLMILCSHGVFAQYKNFEKAKTAYAKGNLKGAVKMIDKCLENPETKKDPRVHLLKSKIMYGIYKDKELNPKYPNALKEALKYAEHDDDQALVVDGELVYEGEENETYFRNLVKLNNKEAMEAFNGDKFAKALPLFKRSLSFGTDTLALVMVGECYWQMNLRIESLPYFKKASRIIYDGVMDDSAGKVYGYYRLPFRQLGKYYIEKKQYDTAYVIVKNGREILPNDPILTDYTYQLMRYALDQIPPSVDYLHMVRQSLKDFPTDSFLNHRENSIYIFLLNGMAKANEQRQFDSMMMVFATSKLEKGKSKNLEMIKKYDIFAGQSNEVFLENIYHYLGDIGLREACYAAFVTWNKKFPLPVQGNATAHIVKQRVKEPFYAEILFRRYQETDPKNAAHAKGRLDYISSRNAANAGYYDLLPLLQMNEAAAKDFPKDAGLKLKTREYRVRLSSEAIDSGDFVLSRKLLTENKLLYADLKKNIEQTWKRNVVQDFKVNYYGTRINAPGKKEAGVPEYKWKGNIEQCLPGKMNDTIIGRLERRINYFRRMAGVNEEIVLTDDNNENCQIAALMCEANKSMSHEPNDGWRCFIPAGFDALNLSILSRDGNPAIAVTAAMGQNHPTVGNRRWLLYPYAQMMGIGTSNNYTSLLAVDNSNKTDTIKYRKTPVCWPPESYCPKMMFYKKWSFSLDQDLKDAVVTMKNGKGENIELKQEALADGYGLNTLVWEPQINAQTLADNDEFHVTVKLKNGTTYQYRVIVAEVQL